MINKKVDDAVFELILTHAFREAFAQEMEQIEAEDSQPAQPSEEHRKQEQRYYKKMQRKPIKAMTIVRGTAACVAAVICLGSVAMMFSPPVRAAVVDTVVGFFEKYVAVNLNENDVLVVDGHTFAYIPYGYKYVDATKSTLVKRYSFSNGSDSFRVCVYAEDQHLLKYDNELANTVPVKINGIDAYFTQSNDGFHSLIWMQDNQTAVIEGNLSFNIMKKIAENFS